MNAQELGAIQAPIKEKFKSHPESAITTLEGHGKLGKDVTFSFMVDGTRVETGLHPAVGGGEANICPATIFGSPRISGVNWRV